MVVVAVEDQQAFERHALVVDLFDRAAHPVEQLPADARIGAAERTDDGEPQRRRVLRDLRRSTRLAESTGRAEPGEELGADHGATYDASVVPRNATENAMLVRNTRSLRTNTSFASAIKRSS